MIGASPPWRSSEATSIWSSSSSTSTSSSTEVASSAFVTMSSVDTLDSEADSAPPPPAGAGSRVPRAPAGAA